MPKKFDQRAVEKRWLRRLKGNPKIMAAVKRAVCIRANMSALREQLSVISHEIDESETVTSESDRWPITALPVGDFTINGEHWWEYGDSNDPKTKLKSLARFLMLKEQQGVDG